jgi:hypothetical protein
VDGYPGFERLPTTGRIQLAACWAHVRRKFYEVDQATGSPMSQLDDLLPWNWASPVAAAA